MLIADLRMSRKTCTATCCVLLKPVEFVRELFPAYSPDVVVKVPPWEEKDLLSYMKQMMSNTLLNLQHCKQCSDRAVKWHSVR